MSHIRTSQDVDGVKHWRCSQCKRLFPKAGFYTNRRTKLGITSACRKCHSATSLRTRNPENTRRLRRESGRRMRKLNPDKYLARELRRAFGISVETYRDLLEQQGGLCAICKQPERIKTGEKVRNLAVDHEHGTGKIRGLLCYRCNTLLGAAEDSPELLRAAAGYLEPVGLGN